MLKKQFILNLRCLAYKASKIKTNLMMKRREKYGYYNEMVVFNNIDFRKREQ